MQIKKTGWKLHKSIFLSSISIFLFIAAVFDISEWINLNKRGVAADAVNLKACTSPFSFWYIKEVLYFTCVYFYTSFSWS